MITDLMQEKELDHLLNFDQLPSFSALVDETFDDSSSEPTQDVFNPNGRLNVPFLLRNAKILLAAEDYDLAKSIFQSLIEHGEALGAAYAGLGVCYEHERKVDLAIRAYREAIIYEPSFTSLMALADLCMRSGDFKAAINTLLRANHLPKMRKKESFEIHKSLGNCYLRTQQLDHAEVHYREAFALVPDSPTLLVNIGCLSLARQDPDAATLHFHEALRFDPQSGRASTGLGLAYLLKGEKKSAHDAFVKALELDLKNPTALFYLVKTAYETKTYSTAADILERYIDAQPFNSNLLYALAGLLYNRGDPAGCLATCQRLLNIKPDHAGAEKLIELAAKLINK